MEDMVSFARAFRGRRILVTGHTGFKGGWLCQWLLGMGAEVTGLALPPHTTPNLFDLLDLKRHLRHVEGDLRDAAVAQRVVAETRPDIVLHLAAQPLVRKSYAEPRLTWETNVLGTLHLLEAMRTAPSARACVVVTTDKCYENIGSGQAFRESDPLGGHDPYSASKAACEILVASYRRCWFAHADGMRLASARAGNVVGGGDWSADRLVSDFVRNVLAGRPLVLRNPTAVRPWQHVLEPLAGYLLLAARLMDDDGDGFAEGWNFGPSADSCIPVQAVADLLVKAWGRGEVQVRRDSAQPHEAAHLVLDCRKARERLGWHGVWDVATAIAMLAYWHQAVLDGRDAVAVTTGQIDQYLQAATNQGQAWAPPIHESHHA